jgi:NAD(P)-dependent dehydrogenase (short-subunit alcohol dehydrogenase family)
MTSTVDGPAGVAGRVAVITGASRGLGAGLAARWAEAGLRLGLAARTEPAAPPAPEGVEVLTASVDVTDAEAVEHFGAAVAERFGRIDLWVNNAGVLEPIAPLRDADPAALRDNVEVNVLGVLYGSAAFARHVRSREGGGVLVNVTSGAATSPYAGWSAYCGSKAAVDQITRVVAKEEIEAGLRAYAVSPGIVDTAMQEAIRATPEERFPAVERFRGIARDGAFNSPAWVADHILGLLAYPPTDLDLVVLRVPDQPRT